VALDVLVPCSGETGARWVALLKSIGTINNWYSLITSHQTTRRSVVLEPLQAALQHDTYKATTRHPAQASRQELFN
jgi:hypothetical protein